MLKTIAPVGKEIVVDQSETDEAPLLTPEEEAAINDTPRALKYLEATVLEKIGLASDGQP